MLQSIQNYYLVIYTDQSDLLEVLEIPPNPKIRVVLKNEKDFFAYRYQEHWVKNQRNHRMNRNPDDLRINMLSSEKINFVRESKFLAYFPPTKYYGWCDIDYFRNKPNVPEWPNPAKIRKLDEKKIHYACVQNNSAYLKQLIRHINDKRDDGLPTVEIPPNQKSIAGGFWIGHWTKIDEWTTLYDNRLRAYFEAGYLVKYDEVILADLIFSNLGKFTLYRENIDGEDNWRMFQRILL
jgi:hypothetical protein